MRKRHLFIIFLAYLILILGALFLVGALIASILSWFYFKDANILKKILLELSILIIGLIGFLGALGIFQYLHSFVKTSIEVKKLEEEAKKIEEEVKGLENK